MWWIFAIFVGWVLRVRKNRLSRRRRRFRCRFFTVHRFVLKLLSVPLSHSISNACVRVCARYAVGHPIQRVCVCVSACWVSRWCSVLSERNTSVFMIEKQFLLCYCCMWISTKHILYTHRASLFDYSPIYLLPLLPLLLPPRVLLLLLLQFFFVNSLWPWCFQQNYKTCVCVCLCRLNAIHVYVCIYSLNDSVSEKLFIGRLNVTLVVCLN